MKKPSRKTVAIITGSRAEFGLLRPVIDAVRKHKGLKLQLIAAGAHFLPPARTIREVEAAYPIAAKVPMQHSPERQRRGSPSGRLADAAATARGIAGFTNAFARLKPDWVVVLGDRIEAFAAASAASIGGIAVAHIHGGDRAEGIADEAMRHAITKLAHLHLPATKLSGERILRMGEKPGSIHVVGSPAIDGLRQIRPPSQRDYASLDEPGAILLMHPAGLSADEEFLWATSACLIAQKIAGDRPVIWLEPNHDPGREHTIRAVSKLDWPSGLMQSAHMPRPKLVGLLKALANEAGALVGNSSAGLIEAEATGVPVINLGPRQSGRQSHVRVHSVEDLGNLGALSSYPAIVRRLARKRASSSYGDGRAGPRIAALLAKLDPHDQGMLRKRNAY